MTRFGLPDWAENRRDKRWQKKLSAELSSGSVSSTPLAPTLPRWPLKYKSDGELRGRRLLSGCWAGWWCRIMSYRNRKVGRGAGRLKISHDWPWLSFTKSNGQEASLNLKLEKTRCYFYLEKSKISTIFTSLSISRPVLVDRGIREESDFLQTWSIFKLVAVFGKFGNCY